MILENYTEALIQSFLNLTEKTISFLPQIIGALAIMLIGIFVALLLSKLIKKIISASRIDKILKEFGVNTLTKKIGVAFDLGDVISWLVKWFVIIAFLLAASEILNLGEVSNFLNKILAYIPEVVIAIIIVMIGTTVGNLLARLIKNYLQASGFPYRNMLAMITKWSIYIFTFLAALTQLKIATELITTLFKGIVLMTALAGGLAFGLGGKEIARKSLEEFKKEIKPDKTI